MIVDTFTESGRGRSAPRPAPRVEFRGRSYGQTDRMIANANEGARLGHRVTIFKRTRGELDALRARLDPRVLLRVVGERATNRGQWSNSYRR